MALALYEELTRRISAISDKAYLFFDKIKEVRDWEKCINSARVDFDCAIYGRSFWKIIFKIFLKSIKVFFIR